MTSSDEHRRSSGEISALASFDTPDLETIEERRLQLWIMTLILLFTTVALLGLVLFWDQVRLPPWLSPGQVYLALLSLVMLFSAYAIEKELQLRQLTKLLLNERILTSALTNSLREAQVLLEAGKAVNLGLNLDEVLDTILACSLDLLEGKTGSIMMLQTPDELRTVATSGPSNAPGGRVKLNEGVAGRVAATGEPVLIRGTFDWPHHIPEAHGPRPTSAISVPLIHRDRLIGVLNVNAGESREYNEHDLRALSLFGGQAATAIANAEAFETQRVIAFQSSYQAMHDPLTGLPNRALLIDRTSNALARRRASGRQVVLMFLDLDNFKRVNDSLGHAAGDNVLIRLAERLRASVRTEDSVARFGGDEFAVLLEASNSDEAVTNAQRILRQFALPVAVEGKSLTFSASIGIALQSAKEETAQEIMRNAFTALHVAKDHGKGEVVVFEPEMRSSVLDRLDLEQELRPAVENEKLNVFFQPIMDLADLSIHAFEALVRWHHPERGLLAADAFVPLAEEAGLLPEIDHHVLRASCAFLAEINRGPIAATPASIHVNVSPTTLRDSGFVSELAATINRAEVDPSLVVLEITENVILHDVEKVTSRLRAIKTLGVKLALDDFGTGYSSLGYLRSFPVDVVKIDRMFVEGLGRNGGSSALVQAIVRLGLGLGFEVVVEGIETQEQLESLIDLGCRYGQGYYLSNPLSKNDLMEVIGRPAAPA